MTIRRRERERERERDVNVGIEAKYQAVILARSKGRMDGDGRGRTDGRRAAVTIPISYYVSAQTSCRGKRRSDECGRGRGQSRERQRLESGHGRLDGLVARPKSIECALPRSKERRAWSDTSDKDTRGDFPVGVFACCRRCCRWQ